VLHGSIAPTPESRRYILSMRLRADRSRWRTLKRNWKNRAECRP
jgi:hypothetical protein